MILKFCRQNQFKKLNPCRGYSYLDKIRNFLDKILNFLLLAQKVGPSPTPIWLTLTTKLTILEMSQQQETPFFGIFGYELLPKVPFVSSDLSYFQYKSRAKIASSQKSTFGSHRGEHFDLNF